MARVPLAILSVGLLLAAACGGEDTPFAVGPAPASLQQLTGPWQRQPFALEPSLRGAIERTCRTDMDRGPGSVAALVDVRGGAVAVVRMVGQGAGMCDALEITAAGTINGAGGGWVGNGVEQLAPIGATELAEAQVGSVGGGDLKVAGMVGDRPCRTRHCIGRDRARRCPPDPRHPRERLVRRVVACEQAARPGSKS